MQRQGFCFLLQSSFRSVPWEQLPTNKLEWAYLVSNILLQITSNPTQKCYHQGTKMITSTGNDTWKEHLFFTSQNVILCGHHRQAPLQSET